MSAYFSSHPYERRLFPRKLAIFDIEVGQTAGTCFLALSRTSSSGVEHWPGPFLMSRKGVDTRYLIGLVFRRHTKLAKRWFSPVRLRSPFFINSRYDQRIALEHSSAFGIMRVKK